MVQFDWLPSLLGVGNCLKQFGPAGRGVGQIKNMFSLIFWSTMCVVSHAVCTMVADLKTMYVNNLSIFKSVFQGMF